jgi:hypothetical protein
VGSFLEPHPFHAVPARNLNADPDPECQPNADPRGQDPGLSIEKWLGKIKYDFINIFHLSFGKIKYDYQYFSSKTLDPDPNFEYGSGSQILCGSRSQAPTVGTMFNFLYIRYSIL